MFFSNDYFSKLPAPPCKTLAYNNNIVIIGKRMSAYAAVIVPFTLFLIFKEIQHICIYI